MSTQAIGQNATDMAVSGLGASPVDWLALVQKVAVRQVNGLTIQAHTLDFNKLHSAAAAEYKSRIGINRQDRLPAEVFDAIADAIGKFIDNKLSAFKTDCVSHRVFAAHKASQKMFVRAEVIRRESIMSLAEQHLFATIHVNACVKRLDKAVSENRLDSVPKCQKALDRATDTLKAIEAAQAAVASATSES